MLMSTYIIFRMLLAISSFFFLYIAYASKHRLEGINGGGFQGGSVAKIEDFPYLVRIKIDNTDSPDDYCGGVIVTNRHVLTNAYCVAEVECDSDIYVVPGNSTRGHIVINKYFHPRFTIRDGHFAIAVLELGIPIKYGPKIKPVTLPSSKTIPVSEGALCNVTGMGNDNQLRFATVPILKLTTCQGLLPQYAITKNWICASDILNGIGGCNNDRGYSLICNGVLTGIFAFTGENCGYSPGVYSMVVETLRFIRRFTTPID